MWVVQSSTRGPIGLASLSSIDTVNRKAELSIGLPGVLPPTLGIKTTLMMLHFALVMMPFNKVYAYVYEDNPQALHNAIRLGFVHEGKLNDHFHIAGHGFVNVDQIGLTRQQLRAHAGLKVLAKRKIGQVW
jgi:RimJ/RimL family protein N-acetyltransferase